MAHIEIGKSLITSDLNLVMWRWSCHSIKLHSWTNVDSSKWVWKKNEKKTKKNKMSLRQLSVKHTDTIKSHKAKRNTNTNRKSKFEENESVSK